MTGAATDRLTDNREWRDRIVARLDEIEARLARLDQAHHVAELRAEMRAARLTGWWPT